MGDGSKQKITDFSLLYEQANVSPPLLNESGKAITSAMQNQFPDILGDVTFEQGPIKTFDRAAAKVINTAGQVDQSRTSGITDLVRGRIIVDTPEQIIAVRKFLLEHDAEFGIVKVKDRFAKPSGSHYRDINLSIELENGHIAEIQINQRDMLAASEYTHDAYEEIDAIEKRAQFENRDLTPEELARSRKLNNFAQDIHDRGAAQTAGMDALLNKEGRERLDTDYSTRLKNNPDFILGRTIEPGTKYSRIMQEHPDFLAITKADGGGAYKNLRDQMGITVDKLQISDLAVASLDKPRVLWDTKNNRILADNPEILRNMNVSADKYSGLGVDIEFLPVSPIAKGAVLALEAKSLEVKAQEYKNLVVETPETLTSKFNVDGALKTTVAVDVDDLPTSKWAKAVDNAGGYGNVTTHVMTGAGFALSAFHLKTQLFDENSTFKRDFGNEEVNGRAITALSLDATAFAMDSVVLGTKALQATKLLYAADTLADAAKLSSGLSTVSKFSRFAGPVGLGITVVTTGLEYSIAETNEDGKRAGQAVGAGGGALGGAAIGAGIGVWFFGVGAGVGAAIGGIAGALGGGYAGGEYLDDDFQEYFDDKALADQKRNLEKFIGIGENLEKFMALEDEAATAYEVLEEKFDGLDTSEMNHDDILAIDSLRIAALENAATDYERKRIKLTDNVQGAFLSADDKRTLNEVEEFIQKRYAFLDMKEGRLRDAGDTEALGRLAKDRAGLVEAHKSIMTLQLTNDKLGDKYGRTKEEISQKSTDNIVSVQNAVTGRREHIDEYQDYIHTKQAADAQKVFETTLKGQLERINTVYHNGDTDNELMQKSAVLMGLVESGEMDLQTLRDARSDIDALQKQHAKELRQMNASQLTLRAMTSEQRELRDDDYAQEYAKHNLRTMRVINTRTSELIDTHKTTEQLSDHAMKAAESAAAIEELKAQILIDTEIIPTIKGFSTGTQSMHNLAIDISDERISALFQAKLDITDHTIEITEHSMAIVSIVNQDMYSNMQEIQDSLIKEQERSVPNANTVETLKQISGILEQASEKKIQDIESYELKIKDILENGVEIDGNKFMILTDENKQRLEAMLSSAADMKQQYSAQLASMKDQISLAENDINNRVLQNNNATITLDHKGRVSSYTVDDNTRVFRTQKRPLLVDQDANIYNSASGLKDTDIDLALYSPRQTVTQMGETYQSYWRPDIHHLQTIEDEAERQQVKTQEKALSDVLKDKGIEDAISTPPKSNDGQSSNMVIEANENDEQSAHIINNPVYLEAAIAMEKINGGEALDVLEKKALQDILADPNTDPEILAKLEHNYGDILKTLPSIDNDGIEIEPFTLLQNQGAAIDQFKI